MSAHIRTAYASQQTVGLKGRAVEAAVLEKCVQDMHMLCRKGQASPDEIHKAIDRNREIWAIFVTSIADETSPLPLALRRNMANLALYVEAQMRQALIDADVKALEPIIYINRHLAAGLRGYAGTELPPLPSLGAAVEPLKSAS